MNKDGILREVKIYALSELLVFFIKDGKVLVQKDNNEYALLGGHVKISETSEETLIRKSLRKQVYISNVKE